MEERRIIVLLDWKNIMEGVIAEGGEKGPRSFFLRKAIKEMLDWLEGIGKVVLVFVFAPPPYININLALFDSFEFVPISCLSKITSEKGREDTTDEYIKRYGRKLIENFDFEVFCLGSGDKDFLPIVEMAKKKSMKIAYVIGNENSLAQVLKEKADIHPNQKDKRMIHLFSPIKPD